ncbi:MAG: hypothetical protein ACRESY_11500 [Steroidobacteraceae bacterium]
MVAAISIVGVACRTLGAAAPQAAVLIEPDAAARAELKQVISTALNGAPVRLANNALTQASTLVIDRAEARDAAGLPLNGRELGRPEHFLLFQRGTRCILRQERTARQWVLRHAHCTPLD